MSFGRSMLTFMARVISLPPSRRRSWTPAGQRAFYVASAVKTICRPALVLRAERFTLGCSNQIPGAVAMTHATETTHGPARPPLVMAMDLGRGQWRLGFTIGAGQRPRSRTMFLAILFHAMINTSYNLFPNEGSHYNPVVLAATSTLMVAPILLWRDRPA
jgi:hypothetical protein